MTSLHRGIATETTSSTQTAAADLLQAAAAALLVGTALGMWCRAWSDGSGGPAGAVLADLGAPWIVTAFAVGAVVAGRHRATAPDRASGVLAGGLSGGAALALASLVYYDGSTGPRAVFWMTAGLAIGGLIGGAGATWATWHRSAAGAAAATALGLAVSVEAVARLGGTLWMEPSVVAGLTVLAVAGIGVLTPLLLTRGSALGAAGSLVVLACALPAAGLVVG